MRKSSSSSFKSDKRKESSFQILYGSNDNILINDPNVPKNNSKFHKASKKSESLSDQLSKRISMPNINNDQVQEYLNGEIGENSVTPLNFLKINIASKHMSTEVLNKNSNSNISGDYNFDSRFIFFSNYKILLNNKCVEEQIMKKTKKICLKEALQTKY